MTGPVSPVDRLVAAWVRWEQFPGSRAAATERLAAIAELGLHSSRLHADIATYRNKGYKVPAAVQAACNDQHLPLEKAS